MYTLVVAEKPSVARDIARVLGAKDRGENSLIGGGLYASIGLFYDKFGSYRGAFVMGIVLYAIAGILGAISIDKSRKMKERMGEAAL